MFSTDNSDIQELIKSLDMMDENVNKAVREGLHEGADIIMKEQKRLISGKSKRCAAAISKSRVYANRKNQLGVQTGYMSGAFKNQKGERDESAPVFIGMVFEYGRPGKKGEKTIIQTRNGEKVKVKNGDVAPVSHIRRGFDSKIDEAVQITADKIEKAAIKTMEG